MVEEVDGEVVPLLEEDDDDLCHGASTCGCSLPPHGAMFEALCGRLVRANYKGKACDACLEVLGGKDIIKGVMLRPCWKCGRGGV